jgi:Dolichyl-phosphate-mannose-protein mannosyltransferase
MPSLRDARGPAALLGAFAVGLASFVLYHQVALAGRPRLWSDSYEYAQVARNVAEGKGLRTDALLVREFEELGASRLPAPYLLHDPGQVLVVALFFRLFGSSTTTLAWATGVSLGLLCVLAAALAHQLFGPSARVLAAVLVATAPPMLQFSATGLSEVPAACAFTAFLILFLWARSSLRGLFLAGLAFGATVLIRSNALLLLPLFLPVAATGVVGSWRWPSGRAALASGAARVAVFALGVSLFLAPNVLRSMRELGSPLLSIAGTAGLVRGTGILDEEPLAGVSPLPSTPAVVAHVLAHPEGLIEKSRFQMRRTLHDLLAGGVEPRAVDAAFIVLFLAVGLSRAADEGDSRRSRLRMLVLACAVVAVGVGSAFQLRWRHVYLAWPAATVMVAGFLAHQLRVFDRTTAAFRLRLAGVLVLAFAMGALPLFARPWGPERDRALQALGLFLRMSTPESAVVFLDSHPPLLPSSLAWHARRFIVNYSPSGPERLSADAPDRPAYYLRLYFQPGRRLVREEPEGPVSFVHVARWQDSPGRSQAFLMRRP